MQLLVAAVNLCRFAPEGMISFEGAIQTRDRDQFCLQAHAKNPRTVLPVDAGQSTAT